METLSTNVHKNTNSIVRDDHRQKQLELFRLKHNGLFSSFVFATVLVAFIALEGNDSRAVKMHLQHFNICIRIDIFSRRFPFNFR